jgi:hypothetical protein
MPGPWVTPQRYALIERFKFFLELAWKRARSGERWLQRLARLRVEQGNYRFPVEMHVLRRLYPAPKLS